MMTRLKLADLADEKPVRLTVKISARLHRELLADERALNIEEAEDAPSPEGLIPQMLKRFYTWTAVAMAWIVRPQSCR